MADNVKHQIKRCLGVLSANERTGWKKEVNIVSWNDGPDKLDIRDWSPDHTKMAKGITLTEPESRALALALEELFRRQA